MGADAKKPIGYNSPSRSKNKNLTDSEVKAFKDISSFSESIILKLHNHYCLFCAVQTDDGVIDYNEFCFLIHKLDNTLSRRIFSAIDTNNDQVINFREFIKFFGIFHSGTTEEKVKLSFKIFSDQDKTIKTDTMYKIIYDIVKSERKIKDYFDKNSINMIVQNTFKGILKETKETKETKGKEEIQKETIETKEKEEIQKEIKEIMGKEEIQKETKERKGKEVKEFNNVDKENKGNKEIKEKEIAINTNEYDALREPQVKATSSLAVTSNRKNSNINQNQNQNKGSNTPIRISANTSTTPIKFSENPTTTPISIPSNTSTTPIKIQTNTTSTPVKIQLNTTSTPVKIQPSTNTPGESINFEQYKNLIEKRPTILLWLKLDLEHMKNARINNSTIKRSNTFC